MNGNVDKIILKKISPSASGVMPKENPLLVALTSSLQELPPMRLMIAIAMLLAPAGGGPVLADLYRAIKGNGSTVRLVLLPESILHAQAELIEGFDRFQE